MTGAAIYDASFAGPEVISMNMTGVMIVYSSLFARWGCIVTPQNLLLASCHASNVLAQSNQMRRAVEYKLANGETEQVSGCEVFESARLASYLCFVRTRVCALFTRYL